jgi:hypothetical protein
MRRLEVTSSAGSSGYYLRNDQLYHALSMSPREVQWECKMRLQNPVYGALVESSTFRLLLLVTMRRAILSLGRSIPYIKLLSFIAFAIYTKG